MSRPFAIFLASIFAAVAVSCDRRDDDAPPPPRGQPALTEEPLPPLWHAALQPFPDLRPTYLPAKDIDDTIDPMSDHTHLGGIGLFGRPTYDRVTAFRLLLTTTVYAGDTVGGGGRDSEQGLAFRDLARQPDARAIFLDLARRPQRPAKLYGLRGLAGIDRNLAAAVADELRHDTTEVQTQFGCIGRRHRFSELVDQTFRRP